MALTADKLADLMAAWIQSMVDETTARGNRIFTGTAITGTSETPGVYPTGIAAALAGDLYLYNGTSGDDIGNVYNCTMGGSAAVALWVYSHNIRGGRGEPGPQGAQGIQGPQGVKGDDGDKGDTGNVMFATFDVDIETGMLTMTTPDGYTGPSFALNEGTGMLEVSIEGSENETLLGKAAFVPKGAYDVDVEYSRLDLVTKDGNCYIYINSTPGTGEALTDPDYWLMIAQRGKAYTILGQYDTLVALEAAVTDPDIGAQYYVGTTSPRNVYRWDGSAWIDDGVLQGPPGPEGPAGQDAVPRQTFVIELPAEDWSEDAPFTQTVEIEEMTADTDFIVDVILSDTLATAIDERKSYAYIDKAEGFDGSVKFTCLSVKPAVGLTLQVRSV